MPYLTPEQVYQLAEAAKQSLRGDRDYLLVRLLFQTGLRVSEAIALTPRHITQFEGKPVLQVLGKGRKPRLVSCPERLALGLKAYAYTHKLNPDDRFFKINRKRAWQITKAASDKAGLTKRVYPHLLRHSDAIEKAEANGEPKGASATPGAQVDAHDNEVSVYAPAGGCLEDSATGGV